MSRFGRRLKPVEAVAEDDDIVIAAITVAQLRVGVELATEAHRATRSEFLAKILQVLPVEPYDVSAAQAHGRLLAHVRRTGSARGAHDLVIAATAMTTRRTIITTDGTTRFGELPGVDCVVLG